MRELSVEYQVQVLRGPMHRAFYETVFKSSSVEEATVRYWSEINSGNYYVRLMMVPAPIALRSYINGKEVT